MKNSDGHRAASAPAGRARTNVFFLSALGRAAAGLRGAGLGRILRVVRNGLDGAAWLFNFPPFAAGIDGVRLRGFFRHRSYLEELARGIYEPCTRALFLEAVPDADVFVDAGAHIGLFSVLAGTHGKPDLSVFAFEPDSYNGKALGYNLRANRCRRVQASPRAVSNAIGAAEFLVSDGTLSSSLILKRKNIGNTFARPIQTTTIDSVLAQIPLRALLIKLDVEGAELMALEGMERSLRRAEKVLLICEMNPAALQAGGRTPAELVRRLLQMGFQTFFLSDEGRAILPVTESFVAKGNLLCLRGWPVPKGWVPE